MTENEYKEMKARLDDMRKRLDEIERKNESV